MFPPYKAQKNLLTSEIPECSYFRLKQTSDFWNNISYVLKKTEDGRRKGVGRSRKEGRKKYLGEDELGNPENIRNYLLNVQKI